MKPGDWNLRLVDGKTQCQADCRKIWPWLPLDIQDTVCIEIGRNNLRKYKLIDLTLITAMGASLFVPKTG